MFRWVGKAQTKGIVYTTRLMWIIEWLLFSARFQSLARRSRYSIWPLKFECDCFLTQNAFWGTGTARHLGPTPRGRLKFGRMLVRDEPEPLVTVA